MGGTLRRRVAPVPMTMSTPAEGAPGPSRLGTGDGGEQPSLRGAARDAGGWRTLNNSRMRVAHPSPLLWRRVGDHEARPSAQGVYVLSRYYRLERL
jgi:hypothetical protein